MKHRQFARTSLDLGRQFDVAHRRPERFPFSASSGRLCFGQVVVTTGCGEGCTHLGVGQSTRQRSIASVPERGGDLRPALIEHEFDESAGIEIDECHDQRRCASTMSATGRFGDGRRRPPAPGRVEEVGRLITPCSVRRSRIDVDSRATIRATGVPRSVMTISAPSRAASIHWPRCALSSVTATSIAEVYISRAHQTHSWRIATSVTSLRPSPPRGLRTGRRSLRWPHDRATGEQVLRPPNDGLGRHPFTA